VVINYRFWWPRAQLAMGFCRSARPESWNRCAPGILSIITTGRLLSLWYLTIINVIWVFCARKTHEPFLDVDEAILVGMFILPIAVRLRIRLVRSIYSDFMTVKWWMTLDASQRTQRFKTPIPSGSLPCQSDQPLSMTGHPRNQSHPRSRLFCHPVLLPRSCPLQTLMSRAESWTTRWIAYKTRERPEVARRGQPHLARWLCSSKARVTRGFLATEKNLSQSSRPLCPSFGWPRRDRSPRRP